MEIILILTTVVIIAIVPFLIYFFIKYKTSNKSPISEQTIQLLNLSEQVNLPDIKSTLEVLDNITQVTDQINYQAIPKKK